MNHSVNGGKITVAFDMKWPVDLLSGIHGLVSIMQIAYQECVYLIKV